jgi:hypothetical protein
MSPENPPPRHLETVAQLMARVGLLDEQVNGKKDDAYFASIQPVALGIFRLVIMGEIKKGKSSFINALCGMPGLVPVHDDVATSTVFKIHYGPTLAYTVFFEPETKLDKLKIDGEDLASYGTEDGNPDNQKKVAFIAVQAPALILKDGLVLVDTPGVGGLFKKHREITFRHAPKADGIFFVTDSIESPIGSDEVKFLTELRQVTPLLYFVQTKAAQVDADARQRRMENNLSILTDKVGLKQEEIRYFVVDSKLKEMADKKKKLALLEPSGFVPLMAYFQQTLKPSRDRNIATVGLRRAWSMLAQIRGALDQQRTILDADTAEKQNALSEDLKATEMKFRQWNEEIRPRLIKEFYEESQRILSDITTEVTEQLRPGGAISEKIGAILSECRDKSPEDVYRMTEPLVNDCRAQVSHLLIASSESLQNRFSHLLVALSEKAGAGITATALVCQDPALIRFADSSLRELAAKAEESRWFDNLRTGAIGGSVGAGLAATVGAVVGSVIPVVGTILGSAVGMSLAALWGGYVATTNSQSKESAIARREVHATIERDLSASLTQIVQGLQKAFQSLRLNAEETVGEMVKANLDRLAETRGELKKRSLTTAQEVAQSRLKLEGWDQLSKSVQKELEDMETVLK